MQKLVKDYLNELKKQRKRRRNAGIAMLLLAVLVVGGVMGILTRYGVAMTGDVVCGIEEHTHVEECYKSELICGLAEDQGHTHGEACLSEPALTCALEEREGHTHGDACYGSESALTCGEEHEHGDGCYESQSSLTCNQEEAEGHTHGDACYTQEVSCGLEEGAGHVHGEACYEKQAVCGIKEHIHTETCYTVSGAGLEGEEPEGLSDEEQAQVDAVISLLEGLPAQEEIGEKFMALMDAEDEEGYNAYYQELYQQVQEAQEAYEALNEKQKQAVTNAEKLEEFSWLWTAVVPNNEEGVMGPDEAYVNAVTIKEMTTGTAPFDNVAGRGNDTTEADNIVRTFDTVSYKFEVNMAPWNQSTTYKEARVKLEFVLPLTEEEAVIDQSAMGWMDTTEGYAPVLTTEMRVIDGQEKECQVLTCYKWLRPSEGNLSVVPGNFGNNLTVYVKSMHDGDTFAPVISAAMEGGAWDGPCGKEEHKEVAEKKTVTPEPVIVTAAPKYNIKLESDSSYRDIFDFQGDGEWMNQYGDKAANTDITTPVPGRLMKLGVTLQLYNDNASKGLKGIELPQGPIEFDLEVSSGYTPTATSEQGVQHDTTEAYTPLLWSYGENRETGYGERNTDGRVLYDNKGCTELAPYYRHEEAREGSDCRDSGVWAAEQKGTTIHITVSDYVIDLEHMPTKNLPGGQDLYGENVGCFSTGAIWIVQPFNKKNSQTDAQGPEYDVIKDYGAGAFATQVEAKNLTATTAAGDRVTEGENGFWQMVRDDDRKVETLELNLPGAMQNRVRYADGEEQWKGVSIENIYNGNDYATVGDGLYLVGGFSYNSNQNAENQLYLGTNLIRFYGDAIELDEDGRPRLIDGASLAGNSGDYFVEWWKEELRKNIRIYYAVKKDGTDWKDDWEMQHTWEDGLVFYESLGAIPEGNVCVGILTCFVGPGPDPEGGAEGGAEKKEDGGYYYYYHKAKIRENDKLAGESFALVSTSRVWTKEMFEQAGLGLESMGLNTAEEVNFPEWILKSGLWENTHYKSANVDDSVYYQREVYREDGSGIEGRHNSEWEHWGDTLLVISYRTSITKNLLQKVDGEEKKDFNLDVGQRVADFRLQPRAYYEKPGSFSHTATVTVVDILPRYMSYKPGSGYFGGKYMQASEEGGIKGSIVRDEASDAKFPDPRLCEPDVKNNADGTQTLTWVIQDVPVGEEMAPIYYSADIGDSGNPDKDIPSGQTVNLKNVAYITTPLDRRDPLSTDEKHAEAGIAVTRGTADSFGKYAKQKVTDEDGEIDYVVYYNNNAETDAQLAMMDAMPMNQIKGSDFTGDYSFVRWKLDIDRCDPANIRIYYTFDKAYEGSSIREIGQEQLGEIEEGRKENWTQATVNPDGNISIPEPEDDQPYPVAWIVTGNLKSGQSVYIDLKIKLNPGASETDKDKNNYFVNLLSSGDTTTTTETPTVRRTLEGLTWMDYNRNGIQDEEAEDRISGVRVELLKLKEGGDPGQEADYENVCYPGTTEPIVIETGYQISVRAEGEAQKQEYEGGRYKFTDLPAGTFAVRFTDGLEMITDLHATKTDCGDDTRDSDGIPVYKDGKLEKTIILDIYMKKAEEMSVALEESRYHDSGFYPDTRINIQKTDKGWEKGLAGAAFRIKDAAGTTLAFTLDSGAGSYTVFGGDIPESEAQVYTELSVNEKGCLAINDLLPGEYVLEEVKAPMGYTLLKEPVRITLNKDNTITPGQWGDTIKDMVEVADEGLLLKIRNDEVYRLPQTGGIGTTVYTISGMLFMMAGALVLYNNKRKEEERI